MAPGPPMGQQLGKSGSLKWEEGCHWEDLTVGSQGTVGGADLVIPRLQRVAGT